MTRVLASSCKLSGCFQQGFSHPTSQRMIVGVIVITVVVLIVRACRPR